ncbi:hypothetical protein ACFPZ0_19675 [Streptomonospora nanhaiensis]|uniref:Uncharacterized protein n=1 Tax=Streptomonospora nanhaiensis TaxID=1323731 RepID=A0A853BS38_9ACTN|nr:hypothetical protein [Streptomonospora nanhaiensis]MBV2363564.1 hypothetical protein [Streptomonospora nanhaiensis]MBX9390250.1 hypothetical protein [Streptomonospora nanhaiensis]NYI98579.1 hypothetical protein [Streptomonospora nanhaiensis]
MSSVWAVGILLAACAVFAIWCLVRWTQQPRTYFRGGLADPERRRFPWWRRGRLAPQTVVEEPADRGIMDTSIDHEAATLIEGPRHESVPITTSIDRETRALVDEDATGRPAVDRSMEVHRPAVRHEAELEPDPVRQRRLAAEEHEKAAEEYRRAAEAREPGGAPADEPAAGEIRRAHTFDRTNRDNV